MAKPRWSQDHIEMLKCGYSVASMESLVRAFGRSAIAIRRHAKTLGLRRVEPDRDGLSKATITHPEGYAVDADNGVVYGRKGQPFRAIARGYVMVNRGDFCRSVHRIIWEAVHGPIPAGMQINHKNGIKHDNRICNLELVTQSENTLHAYRTGLIDMSIASGSAGESTQKRGFWTEDEVATLRADYSSTSAQTIARRLNRSFVSVYQKAAALGLKRKAAQ